MWSRNCQAEIIPVFCGFPRVARSSVFCVMFCRSSFVLLYFFLLVIVLSVLRFTDFDYPFGIFKLFLTNFGLLIDRTLSIYLNVRLQVLASVILLSLISI